METKTEGYAAFVKVSEGRVEMDESEQMLRWLYAGPSGKKEVSIGVTRVGEDEWCTEWERGVEGWVVERLCPEGRLITHVNNPFKKYLIILVHVAYRLDRCASFGCCHLQRKVSAAGMFLPCYS